MPPPEAVYEYYDENYYYELVVPEIEESAPDNNSSLTDVELY